MAYRTKDGYRRRYHRDPAPDASFDFILCHRVLEHVLDDIGAIRELHHILRPGGIPNASEPQAVHREHTAESLVPTRATTGTSGSMIRTSSSGLKTSGSRFV
jgi:2-polyprenyl-3-methyl-5-hydroxy-6-metoxy-1,4-benzoquinol methylase